MSSFHHLLYGEEIAESRSVKSDLTPGLVPSSLVVLSKVPVDAYLPLEKAEEKKKLQQKATDPNIAATDRKTISERLYEDESLKSTKSYALQITPEVKGEFLENKEDKEKRIREGFLNQALKDPALFETLDKPQVQELILFSLLTNPADAKGDNFIVTFPDENGKRKIISIDNDLSLASLIIAEKEDFHTLEARNILFCIPQLMNQPLEDRAKQKFLKQTPSHFLLTWLKSLVFHNEQYQQLLDQDLLDKETFKVLGLPLKLQQGAVKTLLERFVHLQQYLKLCPNTTLQDIFEKISPLAALYYKELRDKKGGDPIRTFDIVYKQTESFENVLKTKLNSYLHNGKTINQALAEETAQKDAYRERTQLLEEAAIEVFWHPITQSLPRDDIDNILENLEFFFPRIIMKMYKGLASISYSPKTFVQQMDKIKSLNFSYSSLKAQDVRFLTVLRSIEELDLRGNNLPFTVLRELLAHPPLKKIDFQRNKHIEEHDLPKLVSLLFDRLSHCYPHLMIDQINKVVKLPFFDENMFRKHQYYDQNENENENEKKNKASFRNIKLKTLRKSENLSLPLEAICKILTFLQEEKIAFDIEDQKEQYQMGLLYLGKPRVITIINFIPEKIFGTTFIGTYVPPFPPDNHEAKVAFEKAGEDPGALYKLSLIYLYGLGVEQDLDKAELYCKKAKKDITFAINARKSYSFLKSLLLPRPNYPY